MQFPQTVEYGLRVMSQLAVMTESGVVRTQDLTKATRIPPHFLAKIMRRLVRHKLLKSQRGCGGGFVLARPLEKIRLIEILAACNYHIDRDHCLFGWARCNSQRPCPIHNTWLEMKTNFQHWAENVTLAQVASNYFSNQNFSMPPPKSRRSNSL